MVLADMSQTELTRRKKARTLAAFRNAKPTPPELGPGWQTTDGSLLTERKLGQRSYTMYGGGLTLIEVPGCCAAPAADPGP
jgi:hypothetical protein